ncbi:hypothetical protein [Mycobacterium sp.]|uniref:antitoxin VbhA family protein n=1 Tax=Mycobacterium sp. TaxID=1785 RepID=UPI0025D54446|nr:hypothetical protein [Mycobacterium sp.]
MSTLDQGGVHAYLATLASSALSASQRRVVHNAVVNSALEGPLLSVAPAHDLIDFVAGNISADAYHKRVLARTGIACDDSPPERSR